MHGKNVVDYTLLFFRDSKMNKLRITIFLIISIVLSAVQLALYIWLFGDNIFDLGYILTLILVNLRLLYMYWEFVCVVHENSDTKFLKIAPTLTIFISAVLLKSIGWILKKFYVVENAGSPSEPTESSGENIPLTSAETIKRSNSSESTKSK